MRFLSFSPHCISLIISLVGCSDGGRRTAVAGEHTDMPAAGGGEHDSGTGAGGRVSDASDRPNWDGGAQGTGGTDLRAGGAMAGGARSVGGAHGSGGVADIGGHPGAGGATAAPLDPPPIPDGGWASIKSGLPNFVPPEPGSGSQSGLHNREAVVPPQCYTRTEGVHNPCYVCHQAPIEGLGHENRMADGVLQGDYGFSQTALTNRWGNLFIDRTAEVAAISDEAVRAYIDEDNYTPLTPRLVASGFSGWIPDLWGLQQGAGAFDSQGFAKDKSGWVAFNYKPMPSTFWPTNGSTDDVMIRLADRFQTDRQSNPSRDVYLANLAIVEAAIKGRTEVSCPPIDERIVGVDLDGDGLLGDAHRVVRPQYYVGAAEHERVDTFLYPQGTSFLHTVRYVGVDGDGRVKPSRRMKEVRYMTKDKFFRKSTLGAFYDEEAQEKIEGNLPRYADLKERGIRNPFGWVLQGFIEDADGHLRPNTYEETLFCMGCHSTIGSTIDKTFAFARKVDGASGWRYVDLVGMQDAPSHGEVDGEILTYLQRVGGGAEFRNNPEMAARWFDAAGRVKRDLVKAQDVYGLITPSAERALRLDKAYWAIVRAQAFVHGRDATVAPPANVFDQVDPNVVPLQREYRYRWDIRLDW